MKFRLGKSPSTKRRELQRLLEFLLKKKDDEILDGLVLIEELAEHISTLRSLVERMRSEFLKQTRNEEMIPNPSEGEDQNRRGSSKSSRYSTTLVRIKKFL